jgi:hypothetical protein
MLYGRKIAGVPDAVRWIENYTLPGQFVALRAPAAQAGGEHAAGQQRLRAIVSSPYESRRDSAYIDASLIEVLVDRSGGQEDCALAALGPGDTVEVRAMSAGGLRVWGCLTTRERWGPWVQVG